MFTLNCKGRLLVIDRPIVMGIINTTPDSFFSGSRANGINDVLFRAERMIRDGAMILDIGGQSTRPGSEQVGTEEELNRVIPAIVAVATRFPEIFLSIDSFYSVVVKEAIAAGASIVIDVSAGTLDENLIPVVAELGVPYVLMHMKGHPQTMQMNPAYENVVTEVFDWLNNKICELTKTGIHDIVIDPGFGFGKTSVHNFQLLQQLSYFRQLQKPVMAGLSRKATVYKTLETTADQALNGTTVLHTIALLNGAQILRVHDVKEAVEVVKLIHAYSA